MRVDIHTHSHNSHDSAVSVSDMAKMQIARGTRIMAVTDHCDTFHVDEDMLLDSMRASFLESVHAGRELSGEIKILCGIEVGEAFVYPDKAKRIVERQDYDVVIGSVHLARYGKYADRYYSGIDFSCFAEEELYGYLDCYFEDVINMLDLSELDVLAHLTCPLRYISGKYGREIDISRFDDKIKTIFKNVIERGIALEVNTSSLCMKEGGFMPDEPIIKLYKDMGGRLITTGSDAHVIENASIGFDRAYEMLSHLGFESVVYFEKRRAVHLSI